MARVQAQHRAQHRKQIHDEVSLNNVHFICSNVLKDALVSKFIYLFFKLLTPACCWNYFFSEIQTITARKYRIIIPTQRLILVTKS